MCGVSHIPAMEARFLFITIVAAGGLHKVDAVGQSCSANLTCDARRMENGACMVLVSESYSFYDCVSACEGLGGTLPTVLDQESNLEYFREWVEPERTPMWLGLVQNLNSTTTEGWDTWVGCPASGFTGLYRNWAVSEPNDFCGFNEACSILGTPQDDEALEENEKALFVAEWYDVACSAESKHMCVCELGPSTSPEIFDADHKTMRSDPGEFSQECLNLIFGLILAAVLPSVIGCCCCVCCCVGGFIFWRNHQKKKAQMNQQAQVIQPGFAPDQQPVVMGQPGFAPNQQPVMGQVIGAPQ